MQSLSCSLQNDLGRKFLSESHWFSWVYRLSFQTKITFWYSHYGFFNRDNLFIFNISGVYSLQKNDTVILNSCTCAFHLVYRGGVVPFVAINHSCTLVKTSKSWEISRFVSLYSLIQLQYFLLWFRNRSRLPRQSAHSSKHIELITGTFLFRKILLYFDFTEEIY